MYLPFQALKTAQLNPRNESHHESLITARVHQGLLKYLSLIKLEHGNRITAMLFITDCAFA